MVHICIKFEWKAMDAITTAGDGRLLFPRLPEIPGAYAFHLEGGQHESLYIGETDNLRRRMVGYRTPGPTQRTNIRMNERLVSHIASGGNARVEVATEATLDVDGARANLDLARRASRLLLENAALLSTSLSEDMIENL